MLGSLYSGITGMDAAAANMDVIGNNIANVNTCAYKSGTISFASVYSESVNILGGKPGNEEGKGVQVVGLNSIWEQGALESTMNPTDLSITGEGFFQVREGAGAASDPIYYTRAGQFRWDANSNLTDPEGRLVMGFGCTASVDLTNGGYSLTGVTTSSVIPINVSGATYSDPQIETDGFVTVQSTNGRIPLFQVAVCTFPNNEGLIKTTGNLYEMSNESGSVNINQPEQNGAGKVNNNHLEMSNVDLAREFVDLIVAQRSFQANSRVISSSADMLQEVINIIR